MNDGVHTLDVEKLSDYLTQQLDEFTGIKKSKKFNTGQSNPTYLLETAEKRHFPLRGSRPAPRFFLFSQFTTFLLHLFRSGVTGECILGVIRLMIIENKLTNKPRLKRPVHVIFLLYERVSGG